MKKIIMTIAVLAVAGMAANATELFVGRTDGLNEFSYAETAGANNDYTPNGWAGFAPSVTGVAADSGGGVHVAHTTGLSHFSWNGTAFTADGYVGWTGGATGVAIASDGTIITTQGGGMNAWTYTGSGYTSVPGGGDGTGYIGFAGARDLTIDAAGYIHVLHDGGLSAFTQSGGALTAVAGGYHGGIVNGNSILADGSGNIFAARDSGINAITFNGSSYGLGGWWGIGSTDLAVSSDGTLFATMTGVGQLTSVTYNGANFTQTGYVGMPGAAAVFVDSEDNIHLGKGD
ncbi:MAG: hypothetical protein ABFR33_07945, partial [Verrucomicrobiota bacterium]